MDGILEFVGSAASGGLLGGLFSLGKLWGKYKEKKLAFEHERLMAESDRETMKLELEASKFEAELELEQTEVESDAKALTAALNAEAETRSEIPWVQAVKALTRPVLTGILVLMAFICVMWASDNPYTNEIVFLASTAVTFWFGDRPRRQI